jgi:hypothetical protein
MADMVTARWEDVPAVHHIEEKQERGACYGLSLVTNYYSIEMQNQPLVKWRAPRSRPSVMANLRKRLAVSRAAFGITVHGPELRLERGC